MHDRDDERFRLVHVIEVENEVRKSSDARATHRPAQRSSFVQWIAERRFSNRLNRCGNFVVKPVAQTFLAIFIPKRGVKDFGLRLRQNARPHDGRRC